MSKKGNKKSIPSKNKNQEKIAAKKAAVLGTESKNRQIGRASCRERV